MYNTSEKLIEKQVIEERSSIKTSEKKTNIRNLRYQSLKKIKIYTTFKMIIFKIWLVNKLKFLNYNFGIKKIKLLWSA